MILAGGLLLLTPGFITDILGITMFFPPTRKLWAIAAIYYFRKKMNSGRMNFHYYSPNSETRENSYTREQIIDVIPEKKDDEK